MTEVKITHVDHYEEKDQSKRPVIAGIEAEIARATGRHYSIGWDLLDVRSLGEVRRMLRDVQTSAYYEWVKNARQHTSRRSS